MRTVSLAILILTAAPLAGCCCGYTCCAETIDVAEQVKAGAAGESEVLLETTCLLYTDAAELDALVMATDTQSTVLEQGASDAILQALHDGSRATILAAPSVVTLSGEEARIEVAGAGSKRFVGQRIEMLPRVQDGVDGVELDITASWRGPVGRGKRVVRRTIQESLTIPDGKGVVLFAPAAQGKPRYAVLVRVLRLEADAESD